MLDELVDVMQEIGLELNVDKLKWLANSWADVTDESYLRHQGVRIHKSESIVILCSHFCSDQNELPTIEHRIRCAWSCYSKWAHSLESTADFKLRAKLWSKTVLVSLTWGLQTTRALSKAPPVSSWRARSACSGRWPRSNEDLWGIQSSWRPGWNGRLERCEIPGELLII